MRFSLLLQVAIFTLAGSTFAAPVLGGKDQPPAQPPAHANANPPAGQKPAHEAAPAPAPAAPKPGDVVIVKPSQFLDKNYPKTGGAPDKSRPAVVVMPADKAGVMGVAPIGHKLPSSHTDDPSKYGIPKPANDDRPHFISTGPPNQVHVDNVRPATANGDTPTKISPEHLESLKNKIVENMDAVSAAKKQKVEDAKEMKKEKAPAPAPAPGAGLYDDLPPPSSNQGAKDKGKAAAAPAPAPAHGGLYDDLPPPKNPQSGASGSGASASGSKKRPLERRALYRRVDAITGERLSRRLHARSRYDW